MSGCAFNVADSRVGRSRYRLRRGGQRKIEQGLRSRTPKKFKGRRCSRRDLGRVALPGRCSSTGRRKLSGTCLVAGKAGRRIYRTPRWQRLRKLVFARDGWRCVTCGRMGALECDHVMPVVKSGDWFRMSNLQSLCRTCHIRKSATECRTRVVSDARKQLLELAYGPA